MGDIKSPLEKRSISLDYVSADKFCGPSGDGKFYREIFGKETPIKLDIFHAVQRVLKQTISKISDRAKLSERNLVSSFMKIETMASYEKKYSLCWSNPGKLRTSVTPLETHF